MDPSYGVYISQLVRYVYACSDAIDFNELTQHIIDKVFNKRFVNTNNLKLLLNFFIDRQIWLLVVFGNYLLILLKHYIIFLVLLNWYDWQYVNYQQISNDVDEGNYRLLNGLHQWENHYRIVRLKGLTWKCATTKTRTLTTYL